MNLKLQRLLGRLYRDKEDGDGAGADGGGGADGGVSSGSTDGDGASSAAASGGAASGGAGGEDGGKGAAGTSDDGKGGAAGANPDGPWGADWRQKLAGGDEAALKRLARYADPTAVAKSLVQLQERISRGELRSQLPKDATPEAKAKWREDNGIPAEPGKYDLGDAVPKDEAGRSKAIVDHFLKAAHGADMTSTQVQAALKGYYAAVAEQGEKITTQDKAAVREAEDKLRETWGTNNYRSNMAAVTNLLAAAPEAVRDRFMHGRLADGRPIMADPDTINWLYALSLEINPAATLDVPLDGGLPAGIDSEIAKIEKVMKEDRGAYNKDEKMQGRLRELYEARERLKKAA